MKFADSRITSFLKMMCVLAVGIIVLLSSCITAYSYDDGYVGNGAYWNDKGEIINISKNSFNGCLKYIADKESGCVYFYLNFYDSMLTEKSDEVYLIFNVKNSKNSYCFSVGKDEIISDQELEVSEDFNIYRDYSKLNTKYHGGEIFVALELKNSENKKLDNYISCEYSCGKNNNFDITDDIVLNMLVTTVTKTTAAKTTTEKTTKQTTSKSTTAKTTNTSAKKTTDEITSKSTEAKNTTAQNQGKTSDKSNTSAVKTTKFTTSSAKSASSNKSSTSSAKFSASKYEAEKAEETSEPAETNRQSELNETFEASDLLTDNISSSSDAFAQTEINTGRSAGSKVLAAVGVLILVTGTMLIIAGCVKGKYKIARVEDNDFEKEENDNNTK